MSEFFFSVKKSNGRLLCLSPLTDRILSLSEENVQDKSGYFLYEKVENNDSSSVKIIAQILSEDAVFMLKNSLSMS
jgi:hypothetical protein